MIAKVKVLALSPVFTTFARTGVFLTTPGVPGFGVFLDPVTVNYVVAAFSHLKLALIVCFPVPILLI